MAMTSEICARKLQRPSGRYAPRIFPRSLKSSAFRRSAFVWSRYHTPIAAVMTCPATVAAAAPITPQCRTKIAIGSRMQFAAAPASMENMANCGLPSERMMGLIACPKT